MNKDLLTGRLTRAPEPIQSPNAKRTYLNLAVRNRRSRDGEPVYVSATASPSPFRRRALFTSHNG